MIGGTAQELVAVTIAGGDQRIMNAWGRILYEGQDRASTVGHHGLTDLRHNATQCGPRMLHRQAFRKVLAIEGPGIDDLLAMGVDDFHALAFGEDGRLASSGWNGEQGG
jgi:hypothetical protein